MARPRRATPSKRFNVTIDAADAEVLVTHARDVGRAPATIAAQLLRERLGHLRDGDPAGEGQQLAAAHREIAQLRATVDGLRKRVREQTDADRVAAREPRWQWSIEEILADTVWWQLWLPRLYELMGRTFTQKEGALRDRRQEQLVPDGRGYRDLMSYLFPPVRNRNAEVVAYWTSPRYAEFAFAHSRTDQAGGPNEGTPPSSRAAAWEPTIRHVVVALSALEQAAAPGADAYLLMRTEREITTEWLQTLGYLLGQAEPADFPLSPTRV